jgi:hypothetical protein
MLSGLDHCAMVPEVQMGEGMGIVGKGIGIWDGACDQVRLKMSTLFVIPAGDTLGLLSLVVPSGSRACVRGGGYASWERSRVVSCPSAKLTIMRAVPPMACR